MITIINRKILASLLVIGVVGTLAAGSTFALFNDTETSDTNTFEVGAFDMEVEAEKFHNGEEVESQQFGEDEAPTFAIEDVKPGDVVSNEMEVTMEGNPGFVEMEVNKTEDQENSCTEPEAEAEGGECDGEGDLYENMDMTVSVDNGDGEEVVYEGSADEFENQSIQLDADPSTGVLDAFDNTTNHEVIVETRIPRDTGNEMQTDSGQFSYGFEAVQARHNSPEN